MQQLFVDLRQQAEQVYDPPEEPQGATAAATYYTGTSWTAEQNITGKEIEGHTKKNKTEV